VSNKFKHAEKVGLGEMKFEAFTVNKLTKLPSGSWPHQRWANSQWFGDVVCPCHWG
jgi:hypothetical protein